MFKHKQNRTKGGRVLNFNRALHSYPKEAYFKPEPLKVVPNNYEIDISAIGVFDQGQQGSCTANAWANLYDYRQVTSPPNSALRFHPKFYPAARDYIYYNERVVDGDVNTDGGSFLHTGAQVLSQNGTVSELVYPYGQNDLFNVPNAQMDAWAHTHKLSKVQPVALDANVLVATLAGGNPIVFGMPVYNEFEGLDSDNYILPMPSWYENALGGHANMLYGFTTINGKRYYLDLNSWGLTWGKAGTCLIPEEFVMQFFSDLWTGW